MGKHVKSTKQSKAKKVDPNEEVTYDPSGDGSHYHHGYKERCYCQKFVKKYDEWHKREVIDLGDKCKRKCRTVCEYVVERREEHIHRDGFKKEFDGKWEECHVCSKCGKEGKDCKCKKN